MAGQYLDVRVQQKKDTEANFLNNDPVLLDGEVVTVIMEDGSYKFKIGDGSSTFSALKYLEQNEVYIGETEPTGEEVIWLDTDESIPVEEDTSGIEPTPIISMTSDAFAALNTDTLVEMYNTNGVRATSVAGTLYILMDDGSTVGVNASKLGGKAPEYYMHPRNLLDNSDFTNPVNQRRQTSYTGAGYTIDRWKLTNANSTLTVDNDGITISANGGWCYPQQFITTNENMVGKTFTAAVCLKDGTIHTFGNGVLTTLSPTNNTIIGTRPTLTNGILLGLYIRQDGRLMFQPHIPDGVSLELKWAALYEGSYTADTLPPYVPKENELAACLLYAIGLPDQMRLRVASVNGNTLEVFIPLPCKMRNSGTLPTFDATAFEVRNTSQVAVDGFTFSVVREGSNGILFRATKTAHGLTDGEIRTKVATILSKDL